MIDGSKLTLTTIDGGIREFTENSAEMWASPKSGDKPVELPVDGEQKYHAWITQNFARAILFDEPLLAPGEDGMNAVELIDGMILSSKTGKTVSVPVNRVEYDALIEELKASSRAKTNVKEQRVTDPKFA